MATITAIVLAYDRAAYLQQALASVAGQSRVPDEVVVIDDASPRGPLAQQVDPLGLPVTFHRLRRNSGPAAAAATAIRAASGDYVSFLNDDDLWEPRFVEQLADALSAEPLAGLAFCDHGVIDPDGHRDDALADRLTKQYGRDRLPAGLVGPVGTFARLALIDQTIPAHSFSMSRREVLDAGVVLAGGDVWDFFVPLSIALARFSGTYVPQRLGLYRISPGGVTASQHHPKRRIASASRRLAADLLATRSPHLAEVHRDTRRRAVRHLATGLWAVVTSRSPRVAVHWVDQTAQAVVRPRRRPARSR